LNPWFAADSVVKSHDGGTVLEAVDLPSLDDTADVSIRSQDGNLLPPDGGETPAGTQISHETIREFRIHITANDGHGGLKSIDYHLRPRWFKQEAEKSNGETITLQPGGLTSPQTDGVNVRAAGSNVDFDLYDQLLREAADALGINSWYFGDSPKDVHRTSNVQDAARYVRVHESASGPIHARDGPLVGLAHVLEDDRDGYRKLVQNDSDERDVQKPGFYHTATLGPQRIREVWPSHGLPKEIKHYYKKDYHDRTDGLAHPKLEAAYQTSRTDETLRYDAETVDQIRRELDECVYAVLADAGLDLRAGGDTYVADEIFAAENAMTDAAIVSLELTQIRHEQEAVVYKHLVDGGLSPIEQEALGTLVTDGGEVSPTDIAEVHGRHRDAVYRALRRMDDLVEREYGGVSLKSTYVAELVHDALQEAERAVSHATNATAHALEAADRGLDEKTSAFVAYAQRHGLNFEEQDDAVRLRLGEIDPDVPGHGPRETPRPSDVVKAARREAREILREGHQLWENMNRDETTYRAGKWRACVQVPTQRAALRSSDTDDTERKYLGGEVWKALG
jgi:predicted transcriptional regulator